MTHTHTDRSDKNARFYRHTRVHLQQVTCQDTSLCWLAAFSVLEAASEAKLANLLWLLGLSLPDTSLMLLEPSSIKLTVQA